MIPPLVYAEVRLCPILYFIFPTGLMRLLTVRYSCHFIEKQNLEERHLNREGSLIVMLFIAWEHDCDAVPFVWEYDCDAIPIVLEHNCDAVPIVWEHGFDSVHIVWEHG
jgi:hypothetical protein